MSLRTSLLLNYTLHDDKGPNHEDSKVWAAGDAHVELVGGAYQVYCKKQDFHFGIGKDDTITLLDDRGVVVSDTGELPGTGGDDETYSFFDGEYRYTATPTPGATNLYLEPVDDETTEENELNSINELGRDFFRLNDDGTVKTDSPFPVVVDFYLTMSDESLLEIRTHPAHETYVSYDSLRIVNSDDGIVITNAPSGQIRTKGQLTLTIPACMGVANLPFSLKFDEDESLYGMSKVTLRNHFDDPSYLREYTIHRLNARFGLPFHRTRHVRLYINEEYVGFYVLMEPHDKAYTMQRSFGPFDSNQAGLFKMKTFVAQCPDYEAIMIRMAEARDTPEVYYFERGDHRMDIPTYRPDSRMNCYLFIYGTTYILEKMDMVKGYVDYGYNCSAAFVNLGRIDRDYGPDHLDDAMIAWLDQGFYSQPNNNDNNDNDNHNTHTLGVSPDTVDTNQWLQTLASYAVTLNMDSPMGLVPNNWYLATTNGGRDDWKIVQYDHNTMTTQGGASFVCESRACGYRQIYWPVLRPTCGPLSDNAVFGRILRPDDEEGVEVYLEHVRTLTNLLTDDFFDELRDYGRLIASYAAVDPLAKHVDQATYEALELNLDDNDNDNDHHDEGEDDHTPFLSTLLARRDQVRAQLNAIDDGTLPRNIGDYDDNEMCPDWRDARAEDYVNPRTFDRDASFMCVNAQCERLNICYSDSVCRAKGTGSRVEFLEPFCKYLGAPCNFCYPHSHCGANYDDDSDVFVVTTTSSSSSCENTDVCRDLNKCFDHRSGMCGVDGEFITPQCKKEAANCTACYPNSRCGG